MITNENDNFINRRASFWDNWKHDLASAIKSFEAQSGEKFVNDDDKQYINTVHTLLKNALVTCMRRYHEVLGEQLSAFENGGLLVSKEVKK